MIPAKKPEATPSTIEAVLMKGDLSALSQEQRLNYYNQVCKSLGLNPLTRPFDYLTLNGKLTLYARRDAADQLRKINGISVDIVSRELEHGLYTVQVRAKDRDGRTDEDLGVVPFPDTLKGEFAANMILKAVTKAKRRVTLSLSGLGFMDETEVEDIPEPAKQIHHAGATDVPHKLAVPELENNAGPDFRKFATELLDTMRACPEMNDVFEWQKQNQPIIDQMFERVPKMHGNLMKAIEDITSAAT